MELLYLWIEDYKNIHHQGFNFSPEYRFEFTPTKYKDEANKSIVTEGELFQLDGNGHRISQESSPSNQENSIYENFFEPSQEVKDAWKDRKDEFGNDLRLGKITNITAIIGANGAGKSNLLDFIKNEQGLVLSRVEIFGRITVTRIGKKICISKSRDWKIHKSDSIIEISNTEMGSWGYIFYSNQLSFNLDKNLGGSSPWYTVTSISIDSLFLDSKKIEKIKTELIRNKLKFIHDKPQIKLPFQCPTELNLVLPNYEFPQFFPFKIPYSEELNSFYKKNRQLAEAKYTQERTFHLIKIAFIRKIIHDCLHYNIYQGSKSRIDALLEDLIQDESNQDIKVEDIKIENFIKGFEEFEYFKKNIISFNSFFQELKNKFDVKIEKDRQPTTNDLLPATNELRIEVGKFLEIFDAYQELEWDLFDFEWSPALSSGEDALLNIYSRFYSTLDEINTYNLLILIDEGEVGFHPEWQRKYLKYLIDFFPQIYPGKQIQIILTTHSPFLASDLPKENIIFLKKGEQGEIIESDKSDANGKCIVFDGLKKNKTFGANIHTLLSDGFFLNEGLIGEFAKGKINEVIRTMEPLLKYPKEKRDLEYESRILEKEIDKKLKETEIEHLDKEYESQKEKFNKEKGRIKKIIDAIGEPIVQDKLLQMYYTIESKDAKEAQIKFHQEKIRKLEENDSNKNS